jgi:hypothetical protein
MRGNCNSFRESPRKDLRGLGGQRIMVVWRRALDPADDAERANDAG